MMMKDASLCGLGQTAPNPVLTTLEHFRDEYLAHVVEKRCPAGVCKALIHYEIDAEKCMGCTLCAQGCPRVPSAARRKEPHAIDPALCIKCGICYNECKFDAVQVS